MFSMFISASLYMLSDSEIKDKTAKNGWNHCLLAFPSQHHCTEADLLRRAPAATMRRWHGGQHGEAVRAWPVREKRSYGTP
jgi:hypothetical protein